MDYNSDNIDDNYSVNDNSKNLMERFLKFSSLMKKSVWQSRVNKAFGGVNPHQGQGRILSILKMKPEISQKEMAFLLDIRNQSLGELLAKLEKAGYIERTPSENDKRAMNIKLTESGRKVAEEAGSQKFELDKVFDILTQEEQEQLKEYLDRLIETLEEFSDEKYERDERDERYYDDSSIHQFADFFGDKIHEHIKRGMRGFERRGDFPFGFEDCFHGHGRHQYHKTHKNEENDKNNNGDK